MHNSAIKINKTNCYNNSGILDLKIVLTNNMFKVQYNKINSKLGVS